MSQGGDAWLQHLQGILEEPERVEWVASSGHWSFRDLHPHDLELTTDRIALREVMVFGAFHDLEAMTTIGILRRGEDDSPVIDPRFGELVDGLVAELGN